MERTGQPAGIRSRFAWTGSEPEWSTFVPRSLLDCFAYFLDQNSGRNRFGDDFELIVTFLGDLVKQFGGISGAAHQQDLASAFVAHGKGMLKPVDARHHYVEQNQVGPDAANDGESVNYRGYADRCELFIAQVKNGNEGVGDDGLVVDDENDFGGIQGLVPVVQILTG